jgi:hypothetical protein
MHISVDCPKCGQKSEVNGVQAGGVIVCGHCQTPIPLSEVLQPKKIRLKSVTPESPLPAAPDSATPSPRTAPRLKSEGGYCPKCGKGLPKGGVLCTECGWDKRSNKVTTTDVGNTPPKRAGKFNGVSVAAVLVLLAVVVLVILRWKMS